MAHSTKQQQQRHLVSSAEISRELESAVTDPSTLYRVLFQEQQSRNEELRTEADALRAEVRVLKARTARNVFTRLTMHRDPSLASPADELSVNNNNNSIGIPLSSMSHMRGEEPSSSLMTIHTMKRKATPRRSCSVPNCHRHHMPVAGTAATASRAPAQSRLVSPPRRQPDYWIPPSASPSRTALPPPPPATVIPFLPVQGDERRRLLSSPARPVHVLTSHRDAHVQVMEYRAVRAQASQCSPPETKSAAVNTDESSFEYAPAAAVDVRRGGSDNQHAGPPTGQTAVASSLAVALLREVLLLSLRDDCIAPSVDGSAPEKLHAMSSMFLQTATSMTAQEKRLLLTLRQDVTKQILLLKERVATTSRHASDLEELLHQYQVQGERRVWRDHGDAARKLTHDALASGMGYGPVVAPQSRHDGAAARRGDDPAAFVLHQQQQQRQPHSPTADFNNQSTEYVARLLLQRSLRSDRSVREEDLGPQGGGGGVDHYSQPQQQDDAYRRRRDGDDDDGGAPSEVPLMQEGLESRQRSPESSPVRRGEPQRSTRDRSQIGGSVQSAGGDPRRNHRVPLTEYHGRNEREQGGGSDPFSPLRSVSAIAKSDSHSHLPQRDDHQNSSYYTYATSREGEEEREEHASFHQRQHVSSSSSQVRGAGARQEQRSSPASSSTANPSAVFQANAPSPLKLNQLLYSGGSTATAETFSPLRTILPGHSASLSSPLHENAGGGSQWNIPSTTSTQLSTLGGNGELERYVAWKEAFLKSLSAEPTNEEDSVDL